MKFFLFLLTAAGILLLNGCTTTPMVSQLPTFEANQQKLAELDHWEIRGKIGLRSPSDASSGSLRWEQRGDSLDVVISGPFGAGAIRVSGNKEAITVSQGNEEWHTDDPDYLLEQLIGQPFPATSLHWWIKGLSDPNLPTLNAKTGIDDYPVSFEQGRWLLEIEGYQVVGGMRFPERLILSDRGNRVTLIIQEWRID